MCARVRAYVYVCVFNEFVSFSLAEAASWQPGEPSRSVSQEETNAPCV